MLTSNLVACRASGFFFKRDSEIHGGGAERKRKKKTPASRAYEIKGWY